MSRLEYYNDIEMNELIEEYNLVKDQPETQEQRKIEIKMLRILERQKEECNLHKSYVREIQEQRKMIRILKRETKELKKYIKVFRKLIKTEIKSELRRIELSKFVKEYYFIIDGEPVDIMSNEHLKKLENILKITKMN